MDGPYVGLCETIKFFVRSLALVCFFFRGFFPQGHRTIKAISLRSGERARHERAKPARTRHEEASGEPTRSIPSLLQPARTSHVRNHSQLERLVCRLSEVERLHRLVNSLSTDADRA